MPEDLNKDYAARLNAVGRQLNLFVNHLKVQQRSKKQATNTVREPAEQYSAGQNPQLGDFISPQELGWLSRQTSPDPQSPDPSQDSK
jgi:hypothetical protein